MTYAAWVSSTDRALTMAASHLRVIRAVTPSNADSELLQLEQAFRRGAERRPRWRYEPRPIPADLPRALEGLAAFLETEPPLGPIYAARARELCLEAAIIEATGLPALTALARERFLGSSEEARQDACDADKLALAWTSAAPHGDAAGESSSVSNGANRENKQKSRRDREAELSKKAGSHALVRSCDPTDPRSLVSRMSGEVGQKKLPMQVCVQAGMASLAATGDGVILVAANKWLTTRDVERTVLHEVEGHALPRARASRAPIALFAIGTARGIDDQEGRAIAIEDASGFLDNARRFELGCRHLAARATLGGAEFVEVVQILRKRDATLENALRIASRVQRGGAGVGGLAREIVYLPARCKVARLVSGPLGPKIEEVMRGGRIAADVALDLDAALTPDLAASARNASSRADA